MTATLKPPPTRPAKKPAHDVTHHVPATGKLSDEERAQLRKDRISAAIAILFIIGLIALLVWAAATGEAPQTYDAWDYPPLY